MFDFFFQVGNHYLLQSLNLSELLTYLTMKYVFVFSLKTISFCEILWNNSFMKIAVFTGRTAHLLHIQEPAFLNKARIKITATVKYLISSVMPGSHYKIPYMTDLKWMWPQLLVMNKGKLIYSSATHTTRTKNMVYVSADE